MTEEEVRINYRIMLDLVEKKDKKIETLQEDLEYSNYCNEELRKKITNLNYKIKLLEEDNNDVNVANTIIFELQDRINKAIEYIENQVNIEDIYPDYNEIIRILKGSDKDE